MTIWHLRDIAAGKRKLIKCVDVKVLNVPQFEGLTIETMLEFAQDYDQVMAALPEDKRETMKFARSYLANVIYSIVGEPFATWVHNRVTIRNKKRLLEDSMIELDPEIAAIYQRSTSVSVLNGNSHHLMKGKRSFFFF